MRNLIFIIILCILAVVGYVIYLGAQNAQLMFAQDMARGITDVAQKQAEALDKAQEVQDKLAELALLSKKEDIRTQRTQQLLNVVLTFATVVLLVLFVSLLFYARPHLAADAKRLRKPKGGE